MPNQMSHMGICIFNYFKELLKRSHGQPVTQCSGVRGLRVGAAAAPMNPTTRQPAGLPGPEESRL